MLHSECVVKEALRRSLNFRKERKLLQEELEESSLKESCESDEQLQEWSKHKVKINLLVKTPLHSRSMAVARSG